MPPQYIMTIEGLTRIHDERAVLENIWLAFFPGAKIGVLGNNGAGKSTLLRIMAGGREPVPGHSHALRRTERQTPRRPFT